MEVARIFKNKSAVSAWVCRVALNICLTQFKKTKKRIDADPVPDHFMGTHEEEGVEAEHLNNLYAAIRQLKEADRAIIVLYLEEKSYQEIAEILGTNTNHIGVKINRIKNTLKTLIHG